MPKTGGKPTVAGLLLTDDVVETFEPAKVFSDINAADFSLDFDATGTYLLTSSQDETLRLYDAKLGKQKNTSNSKKYGCTLAKFTHKPSNILYASTKEDDAIRYMSFYDNKFLRYFKGHTKQVVGLEMSPQDDAFLSTGLDNTVRLWDLRTPNCQGLMTLLPGSGKTCIAFDQGGLIFAAGIQSKYLRLYDLKNFENGPFLCFDIVDSEASAPHEWSSIKISNDGDHILISTRSEVLYIVDAYEGHLKHRLKGHMNRTGLSLDANFTPCGNYVYSGSQDGSVYVWSVKSGDSIATLEGHGEPCTAVAWNPRYMMFASADSNLV